MSFTPVSFSAQNLLQPPSHSLWMGGNEPFQSDLCAAAPSANRLAENHEDNYVALDIGGQYFKTTWATLTAQPGKLSNLALELTADGKRAVVQPIFFDRDPRNFSHILGWLRDKKISHHLSMQDQYLLRREAKFFALADLQIELKFIYPHKEQQRSLKDTSLYPLAFARYTAAVYGYGDRNRANSLLFKARSLIGQQGNKEIEKGLTHLFQADPNHPGKLVFPLLCFSFRTEEDPSGIEFAESLGRAFPKSPLVASLLTDMYGRMGNKDRAFSVASSTFKENPDDLLATFSLAKAIYHRGDWAAAIPFFEKAKISCTKKEARRKINLFLASALSREKKHDGAMILWQEVITHSDKPCFDESLYEEFISSFMANGRALEAAEWLEQSIIHHPTSSGLIALAQTYFSLARMREAMEAAMKATKYNMSSEEN